MDCWVNNRWAIWRNIYYQWIDINSKIWKSVNDFNDAAILFEEISGEWFNE